MCKNVLEWTLKRAYEKPSALRDHFKGSFNWSYSRVKPKVFHQKTIRENIQKAGCRHSSVDSSAFAILLPWVRFPSISSTLLYFIVKFVTYLLSQHCGKNEDKNKKRPGLVRLKTKKTKKRTFSISLPRQVSSL